MIQYIVLSTHI
jgi:hypothetical protein